MITLTASGKAHRVLARLEQGPATLSELREAVGVHGAQAKRLWHLIGTCMRCRLVSRDGQEYRLTVEGADALQCLRGGHDAVIAEPGARVFGRAA